MCDISVVYKSILMILGALEMGASLLSNATKIITILSAFFAGDGLENSNNFENHQKSMEIHKNN